MPMQKLLTGEALRTHAVKLGVVLTIDDPNESKGSYEMFRAVISESELQKRVLEAERHIQAQRMGWVAIVASGASVVSAITALLAVYFRYHF